MTSHGRILCVTENDEHWVYGVQPGGIAAPGDDPKMALDAYRQTFTDALIDIAAESASFEEFKTAVAKFFNEINVSMEEDWRREWTRCESRRWICQSAVRRPTATATSMSS